MPRRKVHLVASALVGAAFAAYNGRDLTAPQRAAEIAGTVAGAMLGGMMPDLIEPASTPAHRGAGHSIALLGATSSVALRPGTHAFFVQRAEAAERWATSMPVGSDARQDAELSTLLWRAFGGLVIGVLVGYATHLVLDAGTGRGIPVVARGH